MSRKKKTVVSLVDKAEKAALKNIENLETEVLSVGNPKLAEEAIVEVEAPSKAAYFDAPVESITKVTKKAVKIRKPRISKAVKELSSKLAKLEEELKESVENNSSILTEKLSIEQSRNDLRLAFDEHKIKLRKEVGASTLLRSENSTLRVIVLEIIDIINNRKWYQIVSVFNKIKNIAITWKETGRLTEDLKIKSEKANRAVKNKLVAEGNVKVNSI